MNELKDWNTLWKNYLKKLRLEHVFILHDESLDFLHDLKIHNAKRFIDINHINFGHTVKQEKLLTYELVFIQAEQQLVWFFKSYYMNHGTHAYWTFDEHQNDNGVIEKFKRFSENDKKEIMRTLNHFPFEKMILQVENK